MLAVGEVAILASAGGLGKSTFTLEIASAAVAAADLGAASGDACGLSVAAGPVVVVSYEDSPARIAHRLKWMNPGDVPAAVHLVPDPAPLWTADVDHYGSSHPGAQWDALWRAVRNLRARLVVVDPVSAALADVSTTETGPVRAFLRALTAEATAAGAGVLLVAHDTKAARNAVARGEDPGAGMVAGSAAWYDGARGVLSLVPDPESSDRLLQCVKANYGRTGWGMRLTERLGPGGAFRGLVLGASMDRADIEAAKRPPRRARAAADGAANGKGRPGWDRLMALIDELLAATSPAEILRHVARATWAKAHDGAECPDKRLPAPADLAAWLPECRALERLAAADAMDTVVRTLAVHDEPSRKLVPALTNLDRLIAMVNRLAPPEIAHVTAADLSAVDRAALVHRSVLLGAIFPSWSTPAGEATTIANLFRHWLTDPEHEGDGKTLLGTERVHALWVEARKHDADLRHPLTPLVDAWQGRPVNVDPETRADRASCRRGG